MNRPLENSATHLRIWIKFPYHLLLLFVFSLGRAQDRPKTIIDNKGQTFFLRTYHLGIDNKKITFTTANHETYKDAFICELQKDGVIVAHGEKDYIFKYHTLVKFDDLPSDLKKEYDYRTRDLKAEFFNGAGVVSDMSEKGVLIYLDNAEMTIPHDVFAKGIREKYDTPNAELDKRLAEGIDGMYSFDPKGGYFSGCDIKISAGRFIYYSWSDVPDRERDKPMEGPYTRQKHGLHLENARFFGGGADYLFAMVKNQLALFTPFSYREWKLKGELPSDVLYWNPLK